VNVPFDYIEIKPGVYAKPSNKPARPTIDNHSKGLCAVQSKSTERLPLEAVNEREEACWYAPASRFEITFTVYSVRPCDYDGYDIKALQDFCVTAGIIPDDNWRILSGRIVSCKAATKEQEKTVIEIKSVYDSVTL